MTQSKSGAETALRITRTFRAPRETVFRAWSEAGQLERWFAPSDQYETRVAELDLRPGGRYRFEMRQGTGEEFHLRGEFREVRPPERLVYTWRWRDWQESQPDSLVTVEFHERGSGTEVVLTHEMLSDAPSRERHTHGWTGCIDRLQRLLER